MRKSQAAAYLAALEREIRTHAPEPAATIFLGGGTPNTYHHDEIASLITLLRDRFDKDASVNEITIEVNPELVTAEDLRAYVRAGITRVSIGVQSFVESEIKTLGRKHTPSQITSAVAASRVAEIESVSLDLIFAAPGQTLASWEKSVRAALELGVDHISTYGLTVEEGTPYATWHAREPQAFLEDDAEADLYARGIELLEAGGFEHYEISNFAKPGHRSRHNANYWANGEYIGLGVGAASYRGGERSVHTKELASYMEAVDSGKPIPAESERLDPHAALGEAIMLALRTAQGVGLDAFKERYGVNVGERYERVVARYSEAGLLEIGNGSMRLTKRGKFLANDVCGAFVTFK